MTIQEFVEKFGGSSRPIRSIIDQWALEKRIDDFLGTAVIGGIVIADLLQGGQLVDSIPFEVRDAFKALMGDKANTLEEVRALLIDKINIGDKSVEGLCRKIQGTMGELAFKDNTKGVAELAPSGNQRGWDVRVQGRSDDFQYFQVKVYEDADGVIEKMQELQKELAEGLIKDGPNVVKSIGFAVNNDIYDDVVRMARERELRFEVRKIGETHEHFEDALEQAVKSAEKPPLESFFGELLGGVVTGAALHAAVNGFLCWKGAKDKEEAIEDTLYDSLITAGGLSSACLAESVLLAQLESAVAVLASPVGGIALAGVGIYTRGVLRRLADRRHVAKRLMLGNEKLNRSLEACLAC